jgi:hypothetical protein
MRNEITIDFLAIVDEGVAFDTEVEMTKCVAMKSPHYHGRLKRRVYGLKLNSPSVDERIDSISYYFRNHMNNLN